uniref:transcriptional regulator n=1 Tax=Roseovarius indicus TaxID=540747 RepID=UPI003B52AF7C
MTLVQDIDASQAANDRPPRLRMYLLGPFALTDTRFGRITPKGQKAQGLLALLALAPRNERTRVWLRDRLWSGSNQKRAATNLRQTVFELKRDLGELIDDILVIDSKTISLRADTLWVDAWALDDTPGLYGKLALNPDTQLLEGMDIADEEFEDWLRTERTLWTDKLTRMAETSPRTPASGPALPARPDPQPLLQRMAPPNPSKLCIGYLPSIQHGCDDSTMYLADFILEGIARNLKELEPVNIYDFRNATLPSDTLTGAVEVEYYVRLRTLQIGEAMTFTFFLYRAPNMILEWSQSIQAQRRDVIEDDFGLMHGFISQNVDRLARFLFEGRGTPGGQPPPPQQVAYTALNLMFRLDDNALDNAQTLLDAAQDISPDPIYPALKCYGLSFKLGENVGQLASGEAEETRALVREVLQGNPFNSITLASLGHVLGYGFGDHAAAATLLNRAVELNPTQAFVWDHYALHKLYTGEIDAAYDAARRAVRLGSYSPLRFGFDTTLCMTAMLKGELGQAVTSGRAALTRQPRFSAAMRYLTATYGLQNRPEEARGIYDRLLIEDPDFSDPEIRRKRFRVLHRETEDQILRGLNVCGL